MTARYVMAAVLLAYPFVAAIAMGRWAWRGEMGRVFPAVATGFLGFSGGIATSEAVLWVLARWDLP